MRAPRYIPNPLQSTVSHSQRRLYVNGMSGGSGSGIGSGSGWRPATWAEAERLSERRAYWVERIQLGQCGSGQGWQKWTTTYKSPAPAIDAWFSLTNGFMSAKNEYRVIEAILGGEDGHSQPWILRRVLDERRIRQHEIRQIIAGSGDSGDSSGGR